MRNKRLLSVFCIVAVLIFTIFASYYVMHKQIVVRNNVYDEPLPAAPQTEEPLKGISDTFVLDASFSTHLPLVIIDTNGARPPISTVMPTGQNYFIPIPGVEPYVGGNITVIDTGGMNKLDSAVASKSPIMLKRRGNSSMLYDKAQYTVKLVSESGQKNPLTMLGMAADDEWILNGSMADKSMIRNYLGYRIGSEFVEYTPNSKYCEVVYKDGDNYYYEGVYLMLESIQQGENRVAISDYKTTNAYAAYMVRRDRFDESGLMLKTFKNDPTDHTAKMLGLEYPPQLKVTPQTIKYIEDDISRIEKVLYSDDPGVFALYPNYIDVDSFVSYFIFNEAFGSYDAGLHSTYMYKDVGGKLKMGPIWDFDNAMDNYRAEPLSVEDTAFQTMPYFDRLMADDEFVSKVEKRYAQLRRYTLSEEHIDDTITMTVNYLGPAIDREWYRWAEIYSQDNQYDMHPYVDLDGDTLTRNTKEHRQEIYRLNVSFAKHRVALTTRLSELHGVTTTRTGITSYMGIFLIVALFAFFIPAVSAVRK